MVLGVLLIDENVRGRREQKPNLDQMKQSPDQGGATQTFQRSFYNCGHLSVFVDIS